MYKAVLGLIALILAVNLLSCGSTSATGDTLGGQKIVVVEAGDLTKSDSSISGTGSFVFNTPLASLDSKDSYRIVFTLQKGGSLSLATHSDTALAGGLNIVLSRGAEADTYTAKMVRASGETAMTAVTGDATGDITLQIDAHNDETPAHVVVYPGSDATFTAPIFNSESDGAAPGNGTATYWGITLTKAGITSAVRSDPKFSEE